MSGAKLLSEAATLFVGFVRTYRVSKERAGYAADLSARELREYGLRCCPPGSVEDRWAGALRFWTF